MKGATPIRAGLVTSSALLEKVEDGLQAVKHDDRVHIEERLRPAFADSLDIDTPFTKEHGTENRWDYLLGHRDSGRIVGFEPHSAHDKEIKVVIKKRARAIEQLGDHLRDRVSVADWFWVASGKVDFTAMDKTVNQLANNGIAFIGKQLLAKQLNALAPVANHEMARRQKRAAGGKAGPKKR